MMKRCRRGSLQYLEPGESCEFHLEIRVVPFLESIEEFETEVHDRKISE